MDQAPLEPPSEPLTGDSHAHLLRPLQTFTQSLGSTVTFESIPGATGGWCDQNTRRIVVDKDQPANARLRILTHETIDALGVDYQQYTRSQSEVIVDAVTFTVVRSLGIDADGASIPYLAAWAETADLSVIEKTAGLIDRLAKRLEDAWQLIELDVWAAADADGQVDADEHAADVLAAVAA